MLTYLICLLMFGCIGVVFAQRRAERRAKLAMEIERLEKLARQQPGGAPDRPIDVASASVVEVHARSTPCLLCGGELRVNEHTAETIGGERLRLAYVTCTGCGSSRALYFRVSSPAAGSA